VVSEHQEVMAHLLEVLGREGMTGGGFPTVAEAVAEGVRRRGGSRRGRGRSLGSIAAGGCGETIGAVELGGGTSSTVIEAYRRRGERRRGSSGAGPASVSDW
jgi:hypothetical protein